MSSRQDIRALPEPYRRLHRRLAALLPRPRIVADPLRVLAYGTDASFYRLLPKLVVRVRSTDEVRDVLREAGSLGLPVTFRAGGRGVVGAEADLARAPHGRELGPGPASIGACMIGGIAANNASGMCCGTAQNSYRTVEAMKLVLADGTLLDTADPESRRRFAASHAALLAGLAAIRDEIAADPALHRRIVEKYRIKNTTGYALNAFVDHHEPLEILLRLMIGSEGTLAFLAEVTYRTVPEQPHKASALALSPDVAGAARATVRLQGGPVSAVELMDRASLRSVEAKPGMPPEL